MSEGGLLPPSPEGDVTAVLLGFDFGMRRMGVAVGQHVTKSARPLGTLPMQDGKPDWSRIDALLDTWKPATLVVGLPLQLDGSEQAISRSARAFGVALGARAELPVHFCDERHSSREAATRFAAQRKAGAKRRHDAADLDAMAAAIILESWLIHHHDGRTA